MGAFGCCTPLHICTGAAAQSLPWGGARVGAAPVGTAGAPTAPQGAAGPCFAPSVGLPWLLCVPPPSKELFQLMLFCSISLQGGGVGKCIGA